MVGEIEAISPMQCMSMSSVFPSDVFVLISAVHTRLAHYIEIVPDRQRVGGGGGGRSSLYPLL